ncbi:Arc family DNA-binding protein [Burkholderia anthinoferrum]|nr:Arc family DNA-binding protein [Burkholderia anthinoferrum]
MTKKPFPSEQQERFIVRLPDGMRDRIAEAAKTNNRSMNAEIVARLEESFSEAEPVAIEHIFPKAVAENTKLRLEMAKLRNLVLVERRTNEALNAKIHENARIQVTLDASGHPISWDEISEHLAAIRKTGKFDVVEMHTSVVTPELVSSSKRRDQTAELAEFYKGKTTAKRIRRTKPEDSNQ